MSAARDGTAEAESLSKRTIYVGELGPFMHKDDEFFTACTTGVRQRCVPQGKWLWYRHDGCAESSGRRSPGCVPQDALGEGTGRVLKEEFTDRCLHYG